jgi:pyruvate/2-oxoglutarate dehydrogenase complex dihydrolipoamide acyltransferase (E2) component
VVMVFPNIEKIKQDYTDKYVMVDPQRPELARFADVVGQVKTVNMSGRALVEFLDYHLNIGWYDIELEFLKVVDKPLPKPKEEKKPAPKAEAKPAAVKEASAPAPSKPQAAGKPSTADILAKLKGGGGAAPAAKKEAAPKTAATPAEAGSPGKVDRGKMSVADMIAAAKGGAAPAAKAEAAPVKEEAPAAPAPAPAAAAASPGGVVKIDKSGMSVDAMVAYCREKDAS